MNIKRSQKTVFSRATLYDCDVMTNVNRAISINISYNCVRNIILKNL